MKHITDPTNPDVLRGNVLRVLGMIVDGHRNGMPVSVREIQAAFGFRSVNGAQSHIRRLRKLGLVSRESGKKARTLVPTCKVELVQGSKA